MHSEGSKLMALATGCLFDCGGQTESGREEDDGMGCITKGGV